MPKNLSLTLHLINGYRKEAQLLLSLAALVKMMKIKL